MTRKATIRLYEICMALLVVPVFGLYVGIMAEWWHGIAISFALGVILIAQGDG